jgi:hypothetical protein
MGLLEAAYRHIDQPGALLIILESAIYSNNMDDSKTPEG